MFMNEHEWAYRIYYGCQNLNINWIKIIGNGCRWLTEDMTYLTCNVLNFNMRVKTYFIAVFKKLPQNRANRFLYKYMVFLISSVFRTKNRQSRGSTYTRIIRDFVREANYVEAQSRQLSS